MPYILSKLANNQIYTKYVKGPGNTNVPSVQIEIKGGADVTNKNLITPEGVITKIDSSQLELLKENKDFKRHLEAGVVKYFAVEPKIEKSVQNMEKDNSAPITPDFYTKKGKKPPKTEKAI